MSVTHPCRVRARPVPADGVGTLVFVVLPAGIFVCGNITPPLHFAVGGTQSTTALFAALFWFGFHFAVGGTKSTSALFAAPFFGFRSAVGGTQSTTALLAAPFGGGIFLRWQEGPARLHD